MIENTKIIMNEHEVSLSQEVSEAEHNQDVGAQPPESPAMVVLISTGLLQNEVEVFRPLGAEERRAREVYNREVGRLLEAEEAGGVVEMANRSLHSTPNDDDDDDDKFLPISKTHGPWCYETLAAALCSDENAGISSCKGPKRDACAPDHEGRRLLPLGRHNLGVNGEIRPYVPKARR